MLGARHREIRIDLRVLVARCDQHSFDADLVRQVAHHLDHIVDGRLLEDRRVRRHPKTRRARLLDRVDRDVPQAWVVTDVVMNLAHAVEMDDKRELVARLEDLQVLLEP